MTRGQIVEACKKAVAEALADFEADKALPLEVRRLRLEPGDTLVLRTPQPLSVWVTERLATALAARFVDTPIVVLEAGLDLEVVSKESTDGARAHC